MSELITVTLHSIVSSVNNGGVWGHDETDLGKKANVKKEYGKESEDQFYKNYC